LRIFHVKFPFWKHVENSIRGIRRAARRGYDAIDLDILITKDGVIVVCHWMKPLERDNFKDASHRIQIHALVRELTWAQIETLSTPDGYRILRIEEALKECARDKIIPYLEPKNDVRFEQDWPWQHIVAVARQHRILRRLWVRSILDFPTKGAGLRRVEAARRNGVPRRHTRLIRSK
jgi:glycerophosphoryl diester phosphodiesterase